MLGNVNLAVIHLAMLGVFWFIHKKQYRHAYRTSMVGLWLVLVQITLFDAGYVNFAMSLLLVQNFYLVDRKMN